MKNRITVSLILVATFGCDVRFEPGSTDPDGTTPEQQCIKYEKEEDKKDCLEKSYADWITDGSGPRSLKYKNHAQRVTEIGRVDILFVIDNSYSMKKEQESIADQFDSFLTKIKFFDYQIAIITTDWRDASRPKRGGRFLNFGGGQTVLSKANDHQSNISKFKKTIKAAGLAGTGDERGIRSLNMSIDRVENKNKFFRKDSLLVVIIVSDEVPGVEDGYNTISPQDETDEPETFFQKVKILNRNIAIMANAIICHRQEPKTECTSYASTDPGINKYVLIVNPPDNLKQQYGNIKIGKLGNIEQRNYGSQLGSIAELLMSELPITLPCVPKLPTVAVFMGGERLSDEEVSVNNTLVLVTPKNGFTKGNLVDVRYVCQ